MPTWNLRNRAAIVGVGYTPMLRSTDRSLGAIAVEAALDAIADAGLAREDIDGYIGMPNAPSPAARHLDGVDEISAVYLAAALGMKEPAWLMDQSGQPTGAVAAACHVVASGLCNYVLVLRTMYNPVGRRYQEATQGTAGGPLQYGLPYGVSGGIAMLAHWLERYMHDYGATREALYSVVANDRRHARLNPVAYWRDKELTLDDYMNARPIYAPMCVFDCDIPVTAAGAVIVTTAERARDLRHPPAYVSGVANSLQPGSRIFEISDVARKDVQVAQIYDGFSPFVWNWLERLGYCGTGEAHLYTQDGRIGLGGATPINTFGGQLGEGRLHGMGHLREGVMQVMGRAGERQVPDVQHSLVVNGFVGSHPYFNLMLSRG